MGLRVYPMIARLPGIYVFHNLCFEYHNAVIAAAECLKYKFELQIRNYGACFRRFCFVIGKGTLFLFLGNEFQAAAGISPWLMVHRCANKVFLPNYLFNMRR